MLRAARTRNLGSGQAAISQAGQNAGQELSETNAGIQAKNAGVKVQQQQNAEKGLEGLYGTNVGAGEQALGESNSALKDAGSLSNFWQQLLLQGVQSAGQAAAGAGK